MIRSAYLIRLEPKLKTRKQRMCAIVVMTARGRVLVIIKSILQRQARILLSWRVIVAETAFSVAPIPYGTATAAFL